MFYSLLFSSIFKGCLNRHIKVMKQQFHIVSKAIQITNSNSKKGHLLDG